jgi:ThiF family
LSPEVFEVGVFGTCHGLAPGWVEGYQPSSITTVARLVLPGAYGDLTVTPGTHVANFAGEYPCNKDGLPIEQIRHASGDRIIDKSLVVNHSFSAKPKPENVYRDYHHKMETYAAILSGPAQLIDPQVTAKSFPVISPTEDESVFNYLDSASSRAGITDVTKKLELAKVGIVGLGGTGSYVLDLVAKTPVKEIHLFDGDRLLNHNAFRSPGAPTLEELVEKPFKVAYFQKRYSAMHRHIVAHEFFIGKENVDQIQTMDFVFLCLDQGGPKRLIVERLESWGTSFIDMGMGVALVDGSLGGILRVTTSTPRKRDHVWQMGRIPFTDGDANNDYSQNIQIADLNALNAALAVGKWKKLYGFYRDLQDEHYSAYTLDGNRIINVSARSYQPQAPVKAIPR